MQPENDAKSCLASLLSCTCSRWSYRCSSCATWPRVLQAMTDRWAEHLSPEPLAAAQCWLHAHADEAHKVFFYAPSCVPAKSATATASSSNSTTRTTSITTRTTTRTTAAATTTSSSTTCNGNDDYDAATIATTTRSTTSPGKLPIKLWKQFAGALGISPYVMLLTFTTRGEQQEPSSPSVSSSLSPPPQLKLH